MRKDGSQWTFLHEIYKEDDTQAADIIVEGAWLDLEKRKLGVPPEKMLDVINRFPRTDDFDWMPESKSSKMEP